MLKETAKFSFNDDPIYPRVSVQQYNLAFVIYRFTLT